MRPLSGAHAARDVLPQRAALRTRGGPPSGGFDAFCLRNGIMVILHAGTLLKPLFTYSVSQAPDSTLSLNSVPEL